MAQVFPPKEDRNRVYRCVSGLSLGGGRQADPSCLSYSAVLSPFAASSFLPSIPAIVVDLNTTATVLNATVAIFFVVVGIFPLFWSSLSGVCASSPRIRLFCESLTSESTRRSQAHLRHLAPHLHAWIFGRRSLPKSGCFDLQPYRSGFV